MRHARRFTGLCAAALVLLCGCAQEDRSSAAPGSSAPQTSDGGRPGGSSPETSSGGGHVTLLTLTTRPGAAEEAGDAALLQGTLQLEDECLVVVPDGGGDPVIPVFPEQAVDETGEGMVFTDAGGTELLLAEGAQVAFGGGGGRVHESCLPGTATFTVWQNG